MANEELDYSKFETISPYSEEEAVAAIHSLANEPLAYSISQKFFPDKDEKFMSNALRQINSIDEFQVLIMSKAIKFIISNSMTSFTYDGIGNLSADKKFMAISNHRDIILDPALTQLVLYQNNIPTTEIAVGDNLLQNSLIEKLLRSNRMIKVLRGISARDLYLSSQLLSEYIRYSVTSGHSSVWIAQRQGRTKDGMDETEQGLLKMVDMSGKGDFCKNFEELNIVPMSISYEYEPCAIEKAEEILISRTTKYVKAPGEDIQSIMTGISQPKGQVHLSIGIPLSHEEIFAASLCNRTNDRYQWIRQTVNIRIAQGYKLFKTNFMAYDMLFRTKKFADNYTAEDVEKFNAYLTETLAKARHKELDKKDLREILLGIYANPILNKESRLLNEFRPIAVDYIEQEHEKE
ncbi:MAG: 1-acyl-sn-glycerol-3-phosphate acyltransferase [Bacteroidales bacterium]|nr:1-acyl-sn-glycerol-3-phosphate acyltransferase [Bacteroidales bacterium]